MTREIALEILKSLDVYRGGDIDQAIQFAIKALDNLDKIKAEIMKLDDINPDYPMDRTTHISRNEVLQIIDKYKAGK